MNEVIGHLWLVACIFPLLFFLLLCSSPSCCHCACASASARSRRPLNSMRQGWTLPRKFPFTWARNGRNLAQFFYSHLRLHAVMTVNVQTDQTRGPSTAHTDTQKRVWRRYLLLTYLVVVVVVVVVVTTPPRRLCHADHPRPSLSALLLQLLFPLYGQQTHTP